MDGVELHRVRVTDGLSWAALLSRDELARAARFHFQADHDRFVAGRGATRWLVGKALGIDPCALAFGEGPHGKPFVLGAAGFHFNRSHSGDWVVVATSRQCEVGADVELARPDLDVLDLGRSVLTAPELAALARLSGEARQAAFFRVWSRKEAVLKAWGIGLGLEPRSLEVGVDAAARRRVPGRGGAAGADAACHAALLVEDVDVDAHHAGAVARVDPESAGGG